MDAGVIEFDPDPFGSAVVAPARAPAVPTPIAPRYPGKPVILTLPYPISANRYWRPVPIGKHITIVPTKEAKAYKQQVGWIAKAVGIREPFPWRVTMHLALYPHRPLDWQKRLRADPYWDDDVRCIDLGNCEKVVSDALQGIVYTDDRWIWNQTKDRKEPDGEARVVVTITPLVKANPQGGLL